MINSDDKQLLSLYHPAGMFFKMFGNANNGRNQINWPDVTVKSCSNLPQGNLSQQQWTHTTMKSFGMCAGVSLKRKWETSGAAMSVHTVSTKGTKVLLNLPP